jgi:hypothetical protein
MRIEDLKDTQILSIHNVIKIYMKETIFTVAILDKREMLNNKQI